MPNGDHRTLSPRTWLWLTAIGMCFTLMVVGLSVKVAHNANNISKATQLAVETKLQAKQTAEDLALVLAEGSCRRGNVVRAYLRYRAQQIKADGDTDLARKLFPILNCSGSHRDPLPTQEQIEFIQRLVLHPEPSP